MESSDVTAFRGGCSLFLLARGCSPWAATLGDGVTMPRVLVRRAEALPAALGCADARPGVEVDFVNFLATSGSADSRFDEDDVSSVSSHGAEVADDAL